MKLNKSEVQSILTISSVVSLRLLGIFLILPVFSIYAQEYPGSTLTLSGIAFGIYALFQSLLQIPFGYASDRYGRKNVMIAGLLIFSAGSVICGFADNINELIIARALQGCGAVGAVAIAALGDLTRPSVRAQSFSITGIIIGSTFISSLVLGPLLASFMGFRSLFFILAALGFVAIVLTIYFFPEIKKSEYKSNEPLRGIMSLNMDQEIKKLFVSVFTVSFVLNLFLFVYPLSLQSINVNTAEIWKIYLIIVLPSALFVYPYIRYSEKKGTLGNGTRIGFVFLLLSFALYFFGQNFSYLLYLTGIVFFLGHTIYQSILPAFLTLRIPSRNRGVTSGFYNLSSFFGASVGGMLSGMMYELNTQMPILICILVIFVWIYLGLPAQPDQNTSGQQLE